MKNPTKNSLEGETRQEDTENFPYVTEGETRNIVAQKLISL